MFNTEINFAVRRFVVGLPPYPPTRTSLFVGHDPIVVSVRPA
jgi:hypothetical protein